VRCPSLRLLEGDLQHVRLNVVRVCGLTDALTLGATVQCRPGTGATPPLGARARPPHRSGRALLSYPHVARPSLYPTPMSHAAAASEGASRALSWQGQTNVCGTDRAGLSFGVSRPSIMRRRELAGRVINLTDKPRPAFDVYIGRRQWCGKEVFEASPWANPFSVKKWGREGAIKRYEEKLRGKPELLARLPELEGKILACWCKPKACHGDVLLRLIEERCGE
jgi:hypothetical protein